MKTTIYSDRAYVLEAQVTLHPITGRTVELFATYPMAQHPRAQRIVCLTLPDESFARLADAIKGGEKC
jgi:hypothetical protein